MPYFDDGKFEEEHKDKLKSEKDWDNKLYREANKSKKDLCSIAERTEHEILALEVFTKERNEIKKALHQDRIWWNKKAKEYYKIAQDLRRQAEIAEEICNMINGRGEIEEEDFEFEEG